MADTSSTTATTTTTTATGRVLPVREAMTVHEFLQLRHVWRDYLDSIPGVRGSFIGYKYVHGVRTTHLAIVVVVDKKIPDDCIDQSARLQPEERIRPKLAAEIGPIKNAEDIWALTDVVSATHSDVVCMSPAQAMGKMTAENQKLVEDLRSSTFEVAGGLAICSVRGHPATDEGVEAKVEKDNENENEKVENQEEEEEEQEEEEKEEEEGESEQTTESNKDLNKNDKQILQQTQHEIEQEEEDDEVIKSDIGSIAIAVRHRDFGLGILTSAHIAGEVGSKVCHSGLLTRPIGTTFLSIATESMFKWMGTPFKDDEETVGIVDCAFVKLPSADWDKLNQGVHGITDTLKEPRPSDLDFPDWNMIGSEVIAVGAGSGVQKGIVAGIGYRYFQNDDRIVYVDYVISSGNNLWPSFSMYGDEGKLIILKDTMQPIAMQFGRWEQLSSGDGRYRCLDAVRVGKRSDTWTFAISLDKILALMKCEIMSNDAVFRLIQQLQQLNYKASGWNYCSVL